MKRIVLVLMCVLSVSGVVWGADYSINVSYQEAMNGLEEAFPMRVLSSIEGKEPRFMGQTDDQLMTLILAGHTANLWKAVLITNYIYVDDRTALQTAAISTQFLTNLVPEWDGHADYFAEMMDLIKQKPVQYTPQKLVENGKVIEFLFVPSAGIVSITVTRKE